MATIVRYSRPTVTPLTDAVDRLFRDAFTWPRLLSEALPRPTGFGLNCNLYDTDEAYIMQVLMPGVKLDELQITAHQNVLTLQGTMGVTAPEGARSLWVSLGGGEFREQTTLPGEVDAEKATADYRDGILTLTLPKAERARAKTIKVNSASKGQPVIKQAK